MIPLIMVTYASHSRSLHDRGETGLTLLYLYPQEHVFDPQQYITTAVPPQQYIRGLLHIASESQSNT